MTAKEAIDYLNHYGWSQWKLGLERTEELLRRVGDPQDGLKFIHVAGTNGKGSTCAMLEKILRTAGYRTGFYPSPFIEDFRERIQVAGEMISEDDLARITERVASEADAMDEHPTHFELITAIGMLYFAEQKCDIVVLEVGLGGTFDSTNVISAPLVSVICNIGLDHTEYLGNTVEEIAATKCGIIKSGSFVACYDNQPDVMEIIERTCREKGCPLYKSVDETLRYPISLIGPHQKKNALTALAVIHAMRDRGWEISEEAVREGLATTVWPARFEVMSKDPLFIIDGGHNPQCAKALTDSLEDYIPGQKVTFIIGILKDKDYEKVLDIVMPYGNEFITLTPDSPRALSADELAQVINKKGGRAVSASTADEAIPLAVSKGLPVVAFGSLYLAGLVRTAFRRWNDK